MAIVSFSSPATDLPYPAITICKRNKYDTSEYLRAVFDNYQYASTCKGSVECPDTDALRNAFGFYVHTDGIKGDVCTVIEDANSDSEYFHSMSCIMFQGWREAFLHHVSTWAKEPAVHAEYSKFGNGIIDLIRYSKSIDR